MHSGNAIPTFLGRLSSVEVASKKQLSPSSPARLAVNPEHSDSSTSMRFQATDDEQSLR